MTASKIHNDQSLISLRQSWKKENNKVVFTNGCFDIIHLGHVDYLERAKELGDHLIVAINTDASVRKLKGETRPINNEYARARIIASLAFVSAVILFSDDTPIKLISTIVPDVLVKGKDYKVEEIVGARVVQSNGGEVITLDFIDGYSTSDLVRRIQEG